MKKFKIVLWVIIIALLVMVYIQNKAFFDTKQGLTLNLYVAGPYQSIQLPVAVWILAALCVGFLFAYFFYLIEKFKTGRLIKAMKAELDAQAKKITQLENESPSRGGYSTDEVMETEPVVADDPPGPEKL